MGEANLLVAAKAATRNFGYTKTAIVSLSLYFIYFWSFLRGLHEDLIYMIDEQFAARHAFSFFVHISITSFTLIVVNSVVSLGYVAASRRSWDDKEYQSRMDSAEHIGNYCG